MDVYYLHVDMCGGPGQNLVERDGESSGLKKGCQIVLKQPHNWHDSLNMLGCHLTWP